MTTADTETDATTSGPAKATGGRGPAPATEPPSLLFRREVDDVPVLPPPPRPAVALNPSPSPAEGGVRPPMVATTLRTAPLPAAPAALPTALGPAAPAPTRRRRRPSTEPTRPRPRSGRRQPEPEPEPVGDPDGVGIYLPASLRRRLRHFWASEVVTDGPRKTYTDIVLDAIEATVGQLRDMLRVAPPRSGPLFSGRIPLRETHDEDQVAVTLRPSVGDLAVIDSLVEEFGASSRSTFVAKALSAYLPGSPSTGGK